MSDDNELSDDQINAAFADIEKQFAPDFGKELDDNLTDNYSLDPQFDDELAGLVGDKAKVALLLTQILEPRFLAALCKICDVDATAVGFTTGCAAIMHDTNGSAPEEAAKALSELISGLSVVECVNRADKISAIHWFNGTRADDFTPPMLFASLDDSIEDLMIGSITPSDLAVAGYSQVESSSFSTDEQAMEYIRTLMNKPFGESENDD